MSALTVPVTGGTVDFRDGDALVCEDVPVANGAAGCGVVPSTAGAHGYIVCVANTLDLLSFLPVFVPGDLRIARAPATVTANPLTVKAGEALPAVTSTVTGLIGSDTIDVTCAGPDPLPAGAPPPARPTTSPTSRSWAAAGRLQATWSGGGKKRFNVRVR